MGFLTFPLVGGQ